MALYMASASSCEGEGLTFRHGDLEISIEQGEAYLHPYPLFLGLKKKNPPQLAVWMEDEEENYLATVYVTHKIATEGWQQAGGNRRKEALPHWCHARGKKYADGLYLPTREEPFTDGLTGATPKESFRVKTTAPASLTRFCLKVEVNHSTDFNEFYSKSVPAGTPGYSGGEEGSGQPALVYVVHVDLSSGRKSFEAELLGHSSPDGSGGAVDPDVSWLTSALRILHRITVVVKE